MLAAVPPGFYGDWHPVLAESARGHRGRAGAVPAARVRSPPEREAARGAGRVHETWDPRGKGFRPNPAHTWASHYADALRTFAVGYDDRSDDGGLRQTHAFHSGNPSSRHAGGAQRYADTRLR